mgnify:CR=1 FL=1
MLFTDMDVHPTDSVQVREYTFVKSLSLFIIVLAALLRQVFSFNLCEDLLLLFVAQKSLIS